jgi:hypothetical protein
MIWLEPPGWWAADQCQVFCELRSCTGLVCDELQCPKLGRPCYARCDALSCGKVLFTPD